MVHTTIQIVLNRQHNPRKKPPYMATLETNPSPSEEKRGPEESALNKLIIKSIKSDQLASIIIMT